MDQTFYSHEFKDDLPAVHIDYTEHFVHRPKSQCCFFLSQDIIFFSIFITVPNCEDWILFGYLSHRCRKNPLCPLCSLWLKNNIFSVEDGAVFAAEFVFSAYAFDGAGLAEAYAAGHHFFHTDLAVDFFIAGELGNSCKHRAGPQA